MIDIAANQPARILLVEDNNDDALLTQEALQSSDLPVLTHVVSNGIAALAFLRREGKYADMLRPDLIFLDLNLPLMNGHEVLKEIREDADLTDIPVIILTTSEAEEDVRKAYTLHANCFVVKEIDFFKFSETIRQIEYFWLQLVKLPRR